MTKAELINQIAEKAGITRVKAEIVVNTIFDSMVDALKRNDRIEIRGFGSFVNRHYDAYQGRNPRTGEIINVQDKKLPFFKVGKELKEAVNKSTHAATSKDVEETDDLGDDEE
ncbi:MAG TPA: HU family DNA-binding protein [Bdellovibrionales bacterium]|nr:HU family DNA-binding protein [Bdellovibrionales bacterium]